MEGGDIKLSTRVLEPLCQLTTNQSEERLHTVEDNKDPDLSPNDSPIKNSHCPAASSELVLDSTLPSLQVAPLLKKAVFPTNTCLLSTGFPVARSQTRVPLQEIPCDSKDSYMWYRFTCALAISCPLLQFYYESDVVWKDSVLTISYFTQPFVLLWDLCMDVCILEEFFYIDRDIALGLAQWNTLRQLSLFSISTTIPSFGSTWVCNSLICPIQRANLRKTSWYSVLTMRHSKEFRTVHDRVAWASILFPRSLISELFFVG